MPGFVNSTLSLCSRRFGRYSSDKIVVYNKSNNYIYAIDFSNSVLAYKKILTNNFPQDDFDYEVDGQDIYIAGNYNQSSLQIGNQTLPALAGSDIPSFITKVNYITDFSSFQGLTNTKTGEAISSTFLKAFIYPNPTTPNLTLRITENDKQSLSAYNLTVTDKMGTVLLRQANYTSGRGVDISRLERGVYFATIVNNKNEKATVAFSKL